MAIFYFTNIEVRKDLFPLVKSLRDTYHSLGAHITLSLTHDHYVSPENKRDLIKFIKGTSNQPF